MPGLRLAFMGTAAFAVPALEAVRAAGHELACVYTRPPSAAGRGHKLTRSPVHDAAERLDLAVRAPASLKDAAEWRAFAELGCDACVVAAYGLILPRAVLEAPRLGCVNVHPSLLPRWRGPAPIPRAIEAGDRETGVTIMAMDEGLDSGPILLVERVPVAADATAGSLHDTLAALGARLVVRALSGLAAGTLEPRPQPAEGVTHAAKPGPAEGRLDWRRPAAELDRQVRAFSPRPGVHFELAGRPVKALSAEVAEGRGAPGTLLADDFTVACGEGALRLTRVQRSGRAPTDGAAFLRGARVPLGAALGAALA
ncbi:MAG: methionyl-tRNA formyltransferase [Proteobacteria bacterium]|nr:methionyl-tRNA formyltransferase [Pseudomonadota bacterium]